MSAALTDNRCRDGGAKDNPFPFGSSTTAKTTHSEDSTGTANETGDFGTSVVAAAMDISLFGSAGFASDAIARNLRHLPDPCATVSIISTTVCAVFGENICRGAGSVGCQYDWPLLSNTP